MFSTFPIFYEFFSIFFKRHDAFSNIFCNRGTSFCSFLNFYIFSHFSEFFRFFCNDRMPFVTCSEKFLEHVLGHSRTLWGTQYSTSRSYICCNGRMPEGIAFYQPYSSALVCQCKSTFLVCQSRLNSLSAFLCFAPSAWHAFVAAAAVVFSDHIFS